MLMGIAFFSFDLISLHLPEILGSRKIVTMFDKYSTDRKEGDLTQARPVTCPHLITKHTETDNHHDNSCSSEQNSGYDCDISLIRSVTEKKKGFLETGGVVFIVGK